jgi:hypothetical protein
VLDAKEISSFHDPMLAVRLVARASGVRKGATSSSTCAISRVES